MKLLYVPVFSAGSFLFLFFLAKIMGRKQLSQMNTFDYIVGITIGSIAAELATELEEPMKPLIAMAVYALLAVAFSLLSIKSRKFRSFVEGKPTVLYNNGKLYRENFKKGKMDIDEFLMECRMNGFFFLEDLQTAMLESNGKISFLPVSTQRPATPSDFNMSPEQERVVINVISDGQILQQGLQKAGKDEQWLKKQLAQQQHKLSDIFLATCDSNGKLTVFPTK